MPSSLHQMKIGLRPRLVQIPSGLRRAGHVIAALHYDARNLCKLVRIANQLALFQPALVYKIVVLNAGKGQRVIALAVFLRGARVG